MRLSVAGGKHHSEARRFTHFDLHAVTEATGEGDTVEVLAVLAGVDGSYVEQDD